MHSKRACVCVALEINFFLIHRLYVFLVVNSILHVCTQTVYLRLIILFLFLGNWYIHIDLSLSLSLSSYTPQVMAWVLPLQQRRIPKTRSRLTKMPSCWSGPLQSPHLLNCSSVPVLIGSLPPMYVHVHVHVTPCHIANTCSAEESKFKYHALSTSRNVFYTYFCIHKNLTKELVVFRSELI